MPSLQIQKEGMKAQDDLLTLQQNVTMFGVTHHESTSYAPSALIMLEVWQMRDDIN